MVYSSKIIEKALKALKKDPLPFFSVSGPADGRSFHWEGLLKGPLNSPYEGGAFKITIYIAPDFPKNLAQIAFKTLMYHPNISANGNVFLNKLLSTGWPVGSTINEVLEWIYELLLEPKVSEGNHVVEEIAEVYKKDRELYEANARAWTKQYAA